MSLSESYRYEVIQSRRDRSRRAFFLARLVGFALMILIVALMRAEPRLRTALMDAGVNKVLQITGRGGGENDISSASMPSSQVKINRFVRAPAAQDYQAIADKTGRDLATRTFGN